SSRRRHTRFSRDWSSDVCSSDLAPHKSKASIKPSKNPALAHICKQPSGKQQIQRINIEYRYAQAARNLYTLWKMIVDEDCWQWDVRRLRLALTQVNDALEQRGRNVRCFQRE